MGWKSKLYTLKHPEKYLGDPDKLIYKSSWEEEAFKVCDNNPYVLEWAYEFVTIPYSAPDFNNSNGNFIPKFYIPDLYIVSQNGNGIVDKKIIEIKPFKQTKRSRAKKPQVRIYEDYTYIINQLKWEAAKMWCEERGIKFIVATEKELFGNRSKR